MKKMLMIASTASMIEQFNMYNINVLQQLGYTVEVACNFKDGNTCSEQKIKDLKVKLDKINVKYYDMDFCRSPFSKMTFVAYRQIKNIIKDNNYTLIHCHTPVCGILTRLVSNKYRKKGTKVIYTAHGFHFFKGAPLKNWLMYYTAEKICSRFTDSLITINKEDFDIAKRKFHAKKVYYIPGVGVNTSKFINVDIDSSQKRRSIGLTDENIIILSVGELSKRKNHEVVIKALGKINNPNIYYIIVGIGENKGYLERIAKENNVNLCLLGYRTDIDELCNIADVFCFPSLQEGLPVALMEAMGSGLPCVVSYIRGNTDLIIEGKGGYLVDPLNDIDFYKNINILVNDETKRFEFGNYNQKTVLNFDINNVNKSMKEIYEVLNFDINNVNKSIKETYEIWINE